MSDAPSNFIALPVICLFFIVFCLFVYCAQPATTSSSGLSYSKPTGTTSTMPYYVPNMCSNLKLNLGLCHGGAVDKNHNDE